MKTKQITLGRTVTAGQYESVRFDITMELEKGDSEEQAWKKLQKEVDSMETKLKREYKRK